MNQTAIPSNFACKFVQNITTAYIWHLIWANTGRKKTSIPHQKPTDCAFQRLQIVIFWQKLAVWLADAEHNRSWQYKRIHRDQDISHNSFS